MSLITTPSAHAVIGCAIKVHRALGPGLFESVYQPCLAHELREAGIGFEEQAIVPLVLTYMRVTGLRKGLLINFNVPVLKDGIKSFVM